MGEEYSIYSWGQARASCARAMAETVGSGWFPLTSGDCIHTTTVSEAQRRKLTAVADAQGLLHARVKLRSGQLWRTARLCHGR
jgi:hypothetical protein